MSKLKNEILRLRSEGKSYKDIVEELNCSLGTVSYHCNPASKDRQLFTQSCRRKEIPFERKIQVNSRSGNKQVTTLNSCLNCGKEGIPRKNTYCSVSCQHELSFKKEYSEWIAGEGRLFGERWLKRAVIFRDGYNCSACGLQDWNSKPISLELEHIDGNPENNISNNLCLICPNCHSQTETYKGKNKGNGRHYRRVRYAEGKSY